MEQWEEALDVDDSDFPSILRPCNRQKLPFSGPNHTLFQLDPSPTLETLNNTSHQRPVTFPTRLHVLPSQEEPSILPSVSSQAAQLDALQPSLSHCSAKRRRVHQSQRHLIISQSDLVLNSGNAETLADSQRPLQVCSDGIRPVHLPRSIPGPAGAILAALRRRSEIRETESQEEMSVLSTQEYLRKAVDANGGDSQFDDDFKKICWVAALDFADRENGELTSSTTVPLGSIKNCGTQKLSKVVAMIKSCSPNGFGDMMVTLKDPSGTISASIHRSVVTEGNNGSYLSVGAVLLLQKVSIFSPSADYYLNITLKNVVKIFPKYFESSPSIVSGLEAVIGCGDITTHRALHSISVPASVVKSPMAQKSSSAGNELTNRGISNQVVGTISSFGRPSMIEQLEVNNSTKVAASTHRNIEKENKPGGDFIVLDSSTDTNNRKQAAVMRGNNQSSFWNEQTGEADKMINKISAVAVKSNGASEQMQSLASLSSLPQWTDEQLEELLVDD